MRAAAAFLPAPLPPCGAPRARALRACAPRMGRRSEKIKGRKDAQTRARTLVFARIGKRITLAARAGGADPASNRALADALADARAARFPKETAARALARAARAPAGAAFRASSFEIIAHGGVGLFVAALTDNANRAAADVRARASRLRLKMAAPGAVAFNFSRRGVVRVAQPAAAQDHLLAAAVDAGALECDPDPAADGVFRIVTDLADLAAARAALAQAGFDVLSARPEMIAVNTVHVQEEDAELNMKAIEMLEELDDVERVYSNMA